MSKSYDVCVIGSGPGGYIAAIRAAQLGLKTAIIEREHLGGICLNWGCIPTKALLRSAEIKHFTETAKDYGIVINGTIAPDIHSIVDRSRKVSARLNAGVNYLMKKNKIDIIWGEAKLQKTDKGVAIAVVAPNHAIRQPQNPIPKNTLGAGLYQAKHIIIATGARARILPNMEPDGKRIWTYFEAMTPKQVPSSLLVMGSGAIGIEFGSFYRDLGAEVTILEMQEHIMPAEDSEVAHFMHKALEKRGIKILTSSKVVKLEKKSDSVIATVETKGGVQTLEASCLISAIGVQANIENIGLEEVGVKTKNHFIEVDCWYQTNVPHIYAIGDVCGAPMLAHKAEEEAVICVEKIAGIAHVQPLDKTKIPACTYASPQVASVGLTEDAAKQKGFDIRVGRYSFSANGKAIALGEEHGFVKTIFNKKTGQLLGAHMIGAEVTELIQGFVIAMNLETTEEELMQTIFPHPSLSEMMKESVLDAYGKVLNA